MSLVLQILRILSGCLFSQSGQIPRFPILPTLGISVLCLFFSLSIALFGNTANHTVFLTESDVVMGTGKNAHGQLSVPVVTQSSVPIQSKFGIRQIASGDHHSVYLMWDGTVWAVGSNSVGQLGDGSTLQPTIPVQVTDGSGNPLSGVVKISAGAIHTVFLMGDRTVWAPVPMNMADLRMEQRLIRVIQYKWWTTLEIHSVEWWISQPVNTIALFLKVMAPSGLPVITNTVRLGMELLSIEMFRSRQWMPLVIHLTQIIQISGGGAHTIVLKTDGTVWASGLNDRGQLGDGTTTERRNPVQVMDGSGNPLSGVRGISAGEYHSVFLRGDGTVWTVGKNDTGQLGDGSTLDNAVHRFRWWTELVIPLAE